MPTIAIIDDNPEQSLTAKYNIELELENMSSTIEVITSFPFREFKEYFNFIEKNEVCVLLLDEQLNDQKFDQKGPVDYLGSQLVSVLRESLKDFPIFALTVTPNKEELTAKYALYEDVIGRLDFIENTEKFVPKILRSAKNYLTKTAIGYERFNELAQIISAGNEDEVLIKELQDLQAKLELPFSGFESKNSWLNEYEKQINELEELNKLIQSKF